MQKWQIRAVEPGAVRVPVARASGAAQTAEVIGVVWDGNPMALDDFLTAAGCDGWQIVGVGNISDHRHRSIFNVHLHKRRGTLSQSLSFLPEVTSMPLVLAPMAGKPKAHYANAARSVIMPCHLAVTTTGGLSRTCGR